MSLHGIKSIEIDDGKNVSNFFAVKIFLLNHLISKLIFSKFVGNKAKGQMSKQMFQENKAHQIFPKTNISYVRVRTRG